MPTAANQNTVYAFLGLYAVAGVVVGVRWYRPVERVGWYCLAAGMFCFAAGDDVTTYYQEIVHNLPSPSAADALYLIGYPFLFVAVARLIPITRERSAREDTAEALVVSLGALAIAWQFLVSDYVNASGGTLGRTVNVAYPMMDIALVFFASRALLRGGARQVYQRLLFAMFTVVLAGDFTYDLLSLHNAYQSGNFVDGFFLVQYTMVAATALHPSVAAAPEAGPVAPTRRRLRTPVVVLGGFVAPVILVVATLAHAHVDVLAMSVISVCVLAVVGVRLIWLLGRLNDASDLLAGQLAQIEEVEERFRLAFEDNMAPMLFTGLDDRVFAVNDAFCEMIGYDRDELLGRGSAPFTYPDDVGITEESFRRVQEGQGDQARYVKRYVRKDGRVIVVEVLRSLARDSKGQPLYHVISERDITEERALATQLTNQALHDSLTGLANRVLFDDRLVQAQARVAREGGRAAVLLLDLDDFKGVNDTLGHVAGDQLLVEVARRLEHVTRSADTLCRFGGDEFLYLAEGLHDAADAEGVAHRLLGALAEPFALAGSRVETRASVGVVMVGANGEGAADYIQDADVALYEAKGAGKDRLAMFSPSMRERAADRFALVQELSRALAGDQLTMHYQPIVDLRAGWVVGLEALMRWHHPERGAISPAVFIPLAENSELIGELGRFALTRATAAAAAWPGDDDGPFVSVNLSARQFLDPQLVDVVDAALRASGLPARRLVIELTEHSMLAHVAETKARMDRLRAEGVTFALDDFGVGFSSLSHLASLRPRLIKIDSSFTQFANSPGSDQALLEAIITFGHRLGLTMLAESVETADQLECLRDFGCELGQGFYWSAAVPEGDVAALLARGALSAPASGRPTPLG
ncbi:MAG TPA: EAL domain-containing protein [Acidimicrobiales bacterium]|nr:EAL domain-containing protein [Acidimicrobiales bacterium]